MTPTVDPIEAIWTAARREHGHRNAERRPGAGISAVLVALLDGDAYGREVARRAGQNQANTTSVWLPRLERLNFVRSVEVLAREVTPRRRCHHSGRASYPYGGGRPARVWSLTRAGRELAVLVAGTRAAA